MLQQSLQDGNMVQNRTRQLSFDYNKVTQKFWRTAHLIHLQNSHAMEIEKKNEQKRFDYVFAHPQRIFTNVSRQDTALGTKYIYLCCLIFFFQVFLGNIALTNSNHSPGYTISFTSCDCAIFLIRFAWFIFTLVNLLNIWPCIQ